MTDRPWRSGMTGVLLVLAVVVHLLAWGQPWQEPHALTTLGTSVFLAMAALAQRGLAQRLVGTAGVLAMATLWTIPNVGRPGWSFFVLLACSWMLSRLWRPNPRAHDPRGGPGPRFEIWVRRASAPRAAAITLLATWVFAGGSRLLPGWRDGPHLLLAALVAAILAIPAIAGAGHRNPRDRVLGALAVLVPLGALIAWAGGVPAATRPLVPLLTAVTVLWLERDLQVTTTSFWTVLLDHPPRILIATFAAQSLLGGLLLVLPAATTAPISLIDALFTSVSATCVTGLNVLDTPSAFTFTGQLTIMLLIQVGGLGIMTFSAASILMMARRVSLKAEATTASLVGAEGIGELRRVLVRVLVVTFATEAVGAAILAARFYAWGDPPALAIWRGIFTSISAFCNAGFALQSDSLVRYDQDFLILDTVAALIIVGGLGPAIIGALATKGFRRAPLGTRLALSTTGWLIIAPVPIIAALEWNGSLSALGAFQKVHNVLFLSVSMRTAGFNSVPMEHITSATVLVCMLWMIIGGCPGSTAGGMKTTTFAVLLLAVRAAITGRNEVEVLGRTIPHAVIYRAGAVATLCIALTGAATVALLITQPMDLPTALFEATSAVGTVGLSVGGTLQVDDIGKIILMICMFLGRVGPLTLLLLFEDGHQRRHVKLPSESVPVG